MVPVGLVQVVGPGASGTAPTRAIAGAGAAHAIAAEQATRTLRVALAATARAQRRILAGALRRTELARRAARATAIDLRVGHVGQVHAAGALLGDVAGLAQGARREADPLRHVAAVGAVVALALHAARAVAGAEGSRRGTVRGAAHALAAHPDQRLAVVRDAVGRLRAALGVAGTTIVASDTAPGATESLRRTGCGRTPRALPREAARTGHPTGGWAW